MNYLDKNEIKRIIKEKNNNIYSHVIIYFDYLKNKYFFRFVDKNENINYIIDEIRNDSNKINAIKEIYNYKLDLNEQLKEPIAYNIFPYDNELNKFESSNKALKLAYKMHKHQYRKDGTKYINHPIRVASLVYKYKKSKNIETLITAAYLHDTIEDTEITYYDIVREFGPQVASLVLELTTDKDLKNKIGKTKYLEIKMKNMSNWALDIKLCDRLDNVIDLINSDENFRNKYIKETVEIINFLIDNRKFNKTQIIILKRISQEINKLNLLFPNKDFNEILTINEKKFVLL